MNEIFCYFVDMPTRIGATVIPNSDGTYTIYINSRLTYEKQCQAYLHEVRHIKNNDLYKESNINEIELVTHKGDQL